MDGLTEGRIVHYVLTNGAHRPAIVVNARRDVNGPAELAAGYVNLIVLLDGPEDPAREMIVHGHLGWAGYVSYSETPAPRTWHWIENG